MEFMKKTKGNPDTVSSTNPLYKIDQIELISLNSNRILSNLPLSNLNNLPLALNKSNSKSKEKKKLEEIKPNPFLINKNLEANNHNNTSKNNRGINLGLLNNSNLRKIDSENSSKGNIRDFININVHQKDNIHNNNVFFKNNPYLANKTFLQLNLLNRQNIVKGSEVNAPVGNGPIEISLREPIQCECVHCIKKLPNELNQNNGEKQNLNETFNVNPQEALMIELAIKLSQETNKIEEIRRNISKEEEKKEQEINSNKVMEKVIYLFNIISQLKEKESSRLLIPNLIWLLKRKK